VVWIAARAAREEDRGSQEKGRRAPEERKEAGECDALHGWGVRLYDEKLKNREFLVRRPR
jgi:hypothetical protein